MLEDRVCGTYWYCVNADGSKWLTNGGKPKKTANGCYILQRSPMGWLCLDREKDYTTSVGIERIYTKDFEGVKFPERTYEDGPLEIEIVKSGNVYWYDD